MSDPRLMALPALCKRAEEQARDLFVARYTDAARGHRDWAEDDNERELCIRAHLSLLADLTRPASRDAVARLVAEALGLECGATAPTLRYDADFRGWVLVGSVDEVVFNDDGVIRSGAGRTTRAPGVCEAGAAEALTLIALAVFGGAS